MLAMIHAMAVPSKGYYLDYGSGTGYGTELLATYFRHAFGIERDQKALAYAKEVHTRSGAMFFPSMEATGLKNPKFDFITCIEVIEHLEKADAEALLKKLADMVADDGTLVLTTPTSSGQAPTNPYHLYEYSATELEEILSAHFNLVEIQDISMGMPNLIVVCQEPKR